jgi:hypothetical protein
MGRIQDKMNEYTNILISRYPPNISYYKISIGYTIKEEAVSDLTPNSSIFTLDNSPPILGSTLFTDSVKKARFNGQNLYYHVFSSNGTDLDYIIGIDTGGKVTFRS